MPTAPSRCRRCCVPTWVAPKRSADALRGFEHRLGDRSMRAGQRIHAMLVRIRHAFRADELDVRDAEEAEGVAQVGFLEIRRAAVAVDAAAAAGHDHALARGEAFRSVLGVAERLA